MSRQGTLATKSYRISNIAPDVKVLIEITQTARARPTRADPDVQSMSAGNTRMLNSPSLRLGTHSCFRPRLLRISVIPDAVGSVFQARCTHQTSIRLALASAQAQAMMTSRHSDNQAGRKHKRTSKIPSHGSDTYPDRGKGIIPVQQSDASHLRSGFAQASDQAHYKASRPSVRIPRPSSSRISTQPNSAVSNHSDNQSFRPSYNHRTGTMDVRPTPL